MAGVARNPAFFPARRVRTRAQPVSKLPSRTGNFTLTLAELLWVSVVRDNTDNRPVRCPRIACSAITDQVSEFAFLWPAEFDDGPDITGESRCSKPVTLCFAETTP